MRVFCILALLCLAGIGCAQIDFEATSEWSNLHGRAQQSHVVAIAAHVKDEPGAWAQTRAPGQQGILRTIRVSEYLKGSGPSELRIRMIPRDKNALAEPPTTGIYFLIRSGEDYEPQYPAHGFSSSMMMSRAGPQPGRYRYFGPVSIPLQSVKRTGRYLTTQLNSIYLSNLDSNANPRSLEPLYKTAWGMAPERDKPLAEEILESLRWHRDDLPRLYRPRNDQERGELLGAQVHAGIQSKGKEYVDHLLRLGPEEQAAIAQPESFGLTRSFGPRFADLLSPTDVHRLFAQAEPTLAAELLSAAILFPSRDPKWDQAAIGRLGEDPSLDQVIRAFFQLRGAVENEKVLLLEAQRLLSTPPRIQSATSLAHEATDATVSAYRVSAANFDSRMNVVVGRVAGVEPAPDGYGRVKLKVERWALGEGPADIVLSFPGYHLKPEQSEQPTLQRLALERGARGLWFFTRYSSQSEGTADSFLKLPEGSPLPKTDPLYPRLSSLRILAIAAESDPNYLLSIPAVIPTWFENAGELLEFRKTLRSVLERTRLTDVTQSLAAQRIAARAGWRQFDSELATIEAGRPSKLEHGSPYLPSLAARLNYVSKAPPDRLIRYSIFAGALSDKQILYRALLKRSGETSELDAWAVRSLEQLFGVKASGDPKQSLRILRAIGELRF